MSERIEKKTCQERAYGKESAKSKLLFFSNEIKSSNCKFIISKNTSFSNKGEFTILHRIIGVIA